MKKKKTCTVICAIVLLSGFYAPAQIIKLSANKETKTRWIKPGETITFTIEEDHQGQKMNRREYTFDGVKPPWADPKRNQNDNFYKAGDWKSKETIKWKATPGTHVLRLFNRYVNPDKNAENREIALYQILTVHVSGWGKKGGYKHPGIDLSSADLDKIKANVFGGKPHIMKKGWASMKADLERDLSFVPHPYKAINGDSVARKRWDLEGWKVRNFALGWAISGDKRYADKAVEILMAWASNCDSLFSGHLSLHMTHYIDPWLKSAELLKHYEGGYSGWSQKDRNRYDQRYVRRLLVPVAMVWNGNIGSPYGTQNQPLNVAKARMMLGIYLDDEALFKNGYNYFYDKNLSGGYGKKWRYKDILGGNPINLFELSIGLNGQFMEGNRDNAHMQMCVVTTQTLMEMLWKQGLNAYETKFLGEKAPRFFQGMLWLIKGIKLEGVDRVGAPTDLKGAIKFSPGGMGAYEMFYNHYRYRLKGKYPFPPEIEQYVLERRKGRMKPRQFIYADLDK